MRGCNSFPGFLRRLFLGSLVFFVAGLLLCATGVHAGGTPIPHGTVELVAENPSIAAGQTFHLGLHFQLEKGWHIYWVNPGDSGEPPRVKWQLPSALTIGAMEWPTPRRLGSSSIADYGYEDAVMLVVPMHAEAGLAASGPASLGAEIRVLVCREMCIPGKAQLSLTLPIKSLPSTADARTVELFAAAREALPLHAPANWKFSISDAKDSFVLTGNVGHAVTQAIFFPLAESQIQNAAPQKLLPVATGFQMTLQKSDQLLKPIEQLKGVLVLSGDRAYLIDAPLTKPDAAGNSSKVGIHAGSIS